VQKPYYEDSQTTLYHGDCLQLLPELVGVPDLIATDPPYPFPGGLCEGWAPAKEFVDQCLATAKALAMFGVPTRASMDVFARTLKAKTFRFWRPTDEMVAPIWFWCEPNMGHARDPLEDGGGLRKPVTLMEQVIDTCRGCVLDPFMGSGSTLLAARNIGVRGIGIERDEALCELLARELGAAPATEPRATEPK
jgi:site-specific DNA-methyltransferase (adenine-specific)